MISKSLHNDLLYNYVGATTGMLRTFFYSTFLIAFLGETARAVEFNETITIDFYDVSQASRKCSNINQTDTQSILTCYRNNGFPYASQCSRNNITGDRELCFGPEITISEFGFDQDLKLDQELLYQIGKFKKGQLYNNSQVSYFIFQLQERFHLKNATAVFEQASDTSVNMIVTGSLPKNSLALGAYYGSDERASIVAQGKHYRTGLHPGFLTYALSSSGGDISRINFAVPWKIKAEATTTAKLLLADNKYKFFDQKIFNLEYNVNKRNHDNKKFVNLDNYGLIFSTEEIEPSHLTKFNTDYVTLYGQWRFEDKTYFDKLTILTELFVTRGESESAKISIEGIRTIKPSWADNMEFRLSGHINAGLGKIKKLPTLERSYLGGPSFRGFYSYEIGRESSIPSDWGGRASSTLQVDFLHKVKGFADNLLVGAHADIGMISHPSLKNTPYFSYGLVGEFLLADKLMLNISSTINELNRSHLTLSLTSEF